MPRDQRQVNRKDAGAADVLPDEVLDHKPDILPPDAVMILVKHESRPHKLPRFAVVPSAEYPNGIRQETSTLDIGQLEQVVERESRLTRRAVQAYHRQFKYPGRKECNAKTAALHAGLARQFARLYFARLGLVPTDEQLPFGTVGREENEP